jgi:tetratricopeptide (TPR) repeat protein
MEVSKTGRTILDNKSALLKEEPLFFDWLKSIPYPRGYDKYLEANKSNVSTSKIFYLQKAIEEEKNWDLYYLELAKVYYENSDYEKALSTSEKAISLELTNKEAILIAMDSASKLDKFPQAEYYLWLTKKWKINDDRINDVQLIINRWRRNFPEVPVYTIPPEIFPN